MLDSFIGVMIMLNNYFHDFATALMVVSAYGMFLILKRAEESNSLELKELSTYLYPKMVHVCGASIVFLFFAGIVRSFTFMDYEYSNAIAHGQITALIIKHILLLVLFFFGISLWMRVHKRIKILRVELKK